MGWGAPKGLRGGVPSGGWPVPYCGGWTSPDGIAATVIALFGQSNALGLAGATPVPSSAVDGELWIDGAQVATYGTTGNVSIEPSITPERSVIKRAVGGSPIADWVSTYLPLLIADAVAADLDPSVSIFVQGEADAKTAPLAAAWPTAADTLFAACTAAWGPQLFVVPKLSGLPVGTYPEMDAWNAGLVAFAAVRSDVLLVETSDLEKLGDSVHYSRTGYDALGQRIADALADRGR